MNHELIARYNVPGPRYTSYPTVPFWEDHDLTSADWLERLQLSFEESNEKEGISLYIHLPFCESLCTFCGCNKRITKNHGVEEGYITAVLKEWSLYCEKLPSRPKIKDLHLGGGTPTFFSPKNLGRLINGILALGEKCEGATFSFEGNPKNTTKAHLEALYELGFRRVSYGIQDFDPKVQEIINRVQSFEQVKEVTDISREVGYTSVNYDIIYGLPLQQEESIRQTIEKVQELRPDRIAYYSYAHVPWIKGVGQRRFTEADLPKDGEKRKLYEIGLEMLEEMGYKEIGMDHFALPSDGLYQATLDRSLHRNFMGYNESTTQLMIGLGVSSIGDAWYAFAQNEKKLETYLERVNAGELPIFRGHLLNEEDVFLRRRILEIMCHFETSWEPGLAIMDAVLPRLEGLVTDSLIQLDPASGSLYVPPKGRPFIRNVCMAFDARLWRKKPETQLFSMTI